MLWTGTSLFCCCFTCGSRRPSSSEIIQAGEVECGAETGAEDAGEGTSPQFAEGVGAREDGAEGG